MFVNINNYKHGGRGIRNINNYKNGVKKIWTVGPFGFIFLHMTSYCRVRSFGPSGHAETPSFAYVWIARHLSRIQFLWY